MGQCVLLDLEEVVLTPEQLANLLADWPPEWMRCCGARETLPSPLPPGIKAYSVVSGNYAD